MLRAVGSTDATIGGGKSRKSGRGAGNSKGPNNIGGNPNFASVTAQLHLDGANGSTTFTDVRAGNVWVARLGGSPVCQLSTAQKKFGTASLTIPSTGPSGIQAPFSGTTIGTNDFCLEGFFYPSSTGAAAGWIMNRSNTAGTARCNYGFIWGDTAQKITFYASRTTTAYQVNIPTDAVVTLNTWHHIAGVRAAGVWAFYLDGTRQATTVTDAAVWEVSAGSSLYLLDSIVAGTLTGHYLDEVRLTNGSSVYSGASFTPPTEPFPDF